KGRFETLFDKKWVHWEGRVKEAPKSFPPYNNRCDVVLENQGISYYLLRLEQGCKLRESDRIAFQGRLKAYQEDSFEIDFPELEEPSLTLAVSDFKLIDVTPSKRVVPERRTQDFR